MSFLIDLFKRKTESKTYKIVCYNCSNIFVQEIVTFVGTESEETFATFPCPKCAEYCRFTIKGQPKL